MKAYMLYESVADYYDTTEIPICYCLSEEKANRMALLLEQVRLGNYLKSSPSSKGVKARKERWFQVFVKEIRLR